MPDKSEPDPAGLEIGDQDILRAMRDIPGYLDITPQDFQQVYRRAYAHALQRLTRGVPAARVMTRAVAAVQADAPLMEVARLMARRRVSGVPVLEDQRVVGLISEKDFLDAMGAEAGRHFMEVVAHCLSQGPCLAQPLRARLARELMSAPPVVVGPETSTAQIGRLFRDKGINRVPVVDGDGRLLGIVSRADLLRVRFPRRRA